MVVQPASLNQTRAQLTVDERVILLDVLFQARLWNRFLALGAKNDVLATVDLMHDEVSLSHIPLTVTAVLCSYRLILHLVSTQTNATAYKTRKD